MPAEEDRIRFLEDPMRLRIAKLCREGRLSLNELAKALGRAPGSLSQPRTMVSHGALTEARRQRSTTGAPVRVFGLTRSWAGALSEAERRNRPTWPNSGQDLVVIPFTSLQAVSELLSSDTEGIGWAAEVRGGAAGLLLAPEAEGSVAAARVLAKLYGVADGLATLRVEEVMSPQELRDWSRRLVESDRALPEGDSK